MKTACTIVLASRSVFVGKVTIKCYIYMYILCNLSILMLHNPTGNLYFSFHFITIPITLYIYCTCVFVLPVPPLLGAVPLLLLPLGPRQGHLAAHQH